MLFIPERTEQNVSISGEKKKQIFFVSNLIQFWGREQKKMFLFRERTEANIFVSGENIANQKNLRRKQNKMHQVL